MSGVILHELPEHPGGGGRTDPLPRVDTGVNPRCGLVSAATPASLKMCKNMPGERPLVGHILAYTDDPHGPALPTQPDLLSRHEVILGLQEVQVGVPGWQR